MRFFPFRKASHRPLLNYPLQPRPRIAVFDSRFGASGTEIVCHGGQEGDLAGLGARTVAAPLQTLLRVGQFAWRPEYPIVVLSSESALLSEDEREQLWQLYEVPVFEQVVGAGGQLLAAECEAHDGLHLYASLTIPGFEVLESLCGCGKFGNKLLNTEARTMTSAFR